MKSRLAFCGLKCHLCPIYRATISGYDYSREVIAHGWSDIYSRRVDPKEVDCRGCRSEEGEKSFSHCYHCSIRSCAMAKEVETCLECSEYPCVDLREFFELVPEAETNLEIALNDRTESAASCSTEQRKGR
ncbi:MAG: DUF3795 domain-containing protein [Candidatus Aegiribacteria sp.]|nr:DUF3795 domain-containing protein [Candidatus Aegiribacteria sp.]MBD3295065.1 DUF3795 domain-containing protein [Candidatus Fermentibacteria bacterium]